jgi:hypothetical protein
MLSTSSRQRAEGHIRRALSGGHGPWSALDSYRARGGRIRWDDWFRLWQRIAKEPTPQLARDPITARATTGTGRKPSQPRRTLLP